MSQIQVLSTLLVLILPSSPFTNLFVSPLDGLYIFKSIYYVPFFTSHKMVFSTFIVLITYPLMSCLPIYFKNTNYLQVIEKTWMKFKTRNKDFFFLGIKVFRGIKGKNVAKKDGSCSFGSTLSLPLSPHLIFILLCISADKITSFPRFYITEKPHTQTDSALSSQSKFFLGQKKSDYTILGQPKLFWPRGTSHTAQHGYARSIGCKRGNKRGVLDDCARCDLTNIGFFIIVTILLLTKYFSTGKL